MRNILLERLPSELGGRVKGAEDLERFFGGWPRFHDAEVIRMALDRAGPTLTFELDAFVTSDQTDERGYYKVERRAIVTWRAHEVSCLEIDDFNHQNVLADLALGLEEREGKVKLSVALQGIFGVHARFLCDELTVLEIEPRLD